jgi:hypothetical protein
MSTVYLSFIHSPAMVGAQIPQVERVKGRRCHLAHLWAQSIQLSQHYRFLNNAAEMGKGYSPEISSFQARI